MQFDMAFLILALLAAAWGFLVGRWWALIAAPPVALWISQVSEVDEVPPWFLGLGYGVVSVLGIAAGVAARSSRLH